MLDGVPIRTVASGLGMRDLAWALQEHSDLWNIHPARTSDPSSPHRDVDDIYVRHAPPGTKDTTVEYEAVWYEPIASLLPVKNIVYDLARAFRADRVGHVLITRIPPGKMVRAHTDINWGTGFYRKFGIQIASAPGQAFCFDKVSHVSKPGDVFEFDNSFRHWVLNQSSEARVTMFVGLRTERSAQVRMSCRD